MTIEECDTIHRDLWYAWTALEDALAATIDVRDAASADEKVAYRRMTKLIDRSILNVREAYRMVNG